MWFIDGKTFGMKKACASFGASHFPLRRLNLKKQNKRPSSDTNGRFNMTKQLNQEGGGGELVFSKTFSHNNNKSLI